MLKKLLFVLCSFAASFVFALTPVDVNKADQTALDGIKGIGPTTSKAILDERKKGAFKDWADFEARVKGVGEKRAASLSKSGLTVNGQSKPNAPAAKAGADTKVAKAEVKPAKVEAKK